MLKFIGTDGSQLYQWTLVPGKYLVGRNPQCDFYVMDPTISRRHAEIDVSANGAEITLVDLGSHNGSVVNGQRVSQAVTLKPGDTVMFGQVEFRISDVDESSGRARLPTTKLSETEPEKSRFLDMSEALKPLPSRITERDEVLPTLFDMAKMLVLPEPREVTLRRSLDLIAKVIPAERMCVMFTDEENKDVCTIAAQRTDGKEMGEFCLSRTIVDQILSEKRAILIGDPTQDPRFAEQQSIIMSEMKSAMAVPLFDQDKVYGILYVDTTDIRHRYDDEFLRLLATFGNIMGSRMLNYQLLEERQQKQVIEAEMNRAASIQRHLLDRTLPTLPGYNIHVYIEPCSAVGGDLYDVVPLPDGRLLFLVADVSGHGMGAALLMSNVLASIRILYEDSDLDLMRIVRQVSNHLCAFTAPEDFATLFIAVLDPDNNQVRFINAGHNPPIVFRSGGDHTHLHASGIMIGAMPFDGWKEETVEMDPGDSLIVFTDGVVEAEDEKEEKYGEMRLERLLEQHRSHTAREMGDRLLEDVLSFVGDAPRGDDITMVIVQRNA